MGQVPRANSFRHALSVRKRSFGKGVSSRSSLGCSFPVWEAKWNVPGNAPSLHAVENHWSCKINLTLVLRVSPPAIEWKTGRKPKTGKNWPKKGKWPTARNGAKMAPKWWNNRKMTIFFAIFSPFGPWAIPSFRQKKTIIPFSAFGPFSILCQADRLATLRCAILSLFC